MALPNNEVTIHQPLGGAGNTEKMTDMIAEMTGQSRNKTLRISADYHGHKALVSLADFKLR